MSENIKRAEEAELSLIAGEAAVSAQSRELWVTPRVLAFERFESARTGMDGDPMEGFFYGPAS